MTKQKSPFTLFNNWLFDRNINSHIPQKDILLKYNSPISKTYLISLFKKVGKLNHYLDKYLNNIGLRYLDNENLFFFIKKCVLDFNVSKRNLSYTYWPKRKSKLYEKLSKKFHNLKNYEIDFLCQIIDNSKDRDRIYQSFGIIISKKKKIKKNKIKKSKVSLLEFLEAFGRMEL